MLWLNCPQHSKETKNTLLKSFAHSPHEKHNILAPPILPSIKLVKSSEMPMIEPILDIVLSKRLQLSSVLFHLSSINQIDKALLTSADVSKCCTETQPKTTNSKQCRCRSTVDRKISLERPESRKKHRGLSLVPLYL